MNHLLETAWGVIANAGEGDWTRESPEWREAAVGDLVGPLRAKRKAKDL